MTVSENGAYTSIVLCGTKSTKKSDPRLAIYETPAEDGPEDETLEPLLVVPDGIMRALFGFCGKKIIFLDKDLWIRAIDLSEAGQGMPEPIAVRHFLIPWELIGGNNRLHGLVKAAGTVVFPKEGEVAVVSHALGWSFVGENEAGKAGRTRRFGAGQHVGSLWLQWLQLN